MADLRYKVVVDDQEAKRKISELLKGSGVSANGSGDGSGDIKKSTDAVRQLTDEQKKLKAAQLENIESTRRLREERSKEISDLNVLKQLEQEAKTIAAERRAAAQNPIKDSSIENAKAITAAKIAEIESRKKNREAIDAEKIALSQSKNDNAIANAKAIKDAQLTTINSLRDARLELEKQKQAIQDLNTEYLQGKIDAQRYAQEQRKLSDAQRESARQAKETKRQLSQNSEYGKLTAELNRLRNESKNLLAEMVKLERQGFKNGAAYQQLESKSRTLVGQTKILDRQIKTIDTTVGQHYRNVGNYGDAISMVLPQISQFAGRLGLLGAVVAGVKKSFTSNLELEPLKQGINAVSSSSVQAEQTMDFLRKTSDRLGLQFSSTAESFKLWQGAAKFSNITASESKRIFESVATAGAKMKLSNDQVQGTFLALSQMMSKGKVQAEELRGQLAERLPGAFQLAAKAMGVTEQELNKMLEKGEVVSKDFLPKFATELEKTFGSDKTERVEGMQASINRLSNEFDKLWQSDRAQSFFTTVTDGLADLTSTIGKLVKSDSWKEFFLRLGGSVSGGIGSQILDIGATGVNAVSNKDNLQRKTFFESFATLTRKEQLAEISRQEKLISDREKYNKALVDPSLRANLEKMKSLVNPEVKPEKKLVDQKAIDKAKKDAERAAERSRQAFERQRALQLEIDKINDNASKRNLTRDQQEILSIREKYAKIREEVRKFNSDPKNKGFKVDTSGLSSSEKQEINDAVYKQQTARILKVYQDDYQNFIKYEDLKRQYGAKVADEQLGLYRSAFEKIAGEYAGLQAKQNMVGLSGLEKERMQELEKMVVAHGKRVQEENLSQYLEALKLSDTYNDQLLAIEKKYQDAFTALGENASKERKEQLRKALQEEVSQLTVANIQKEMQWDRVIQGLQNKTKSGANKSLDYLMQGVNTKFKLGKLSKKDYDDLTGQIDTARFEINLDKSWIASTDALNRYRAAVKAYGKDSDQARKAQKELFTSFSEDISKAQAIISSLDQGLQTLGVSGFEEVFRNVSGILDGAKDIASGNPIGMITGGIKILTNAISLFNTKDKKLQKQIDAYRDQLDSLGKAYDRLQGKLNNSDTNYYDNQNLVLKNLNEQEQAIRAMMKAEEDKKKTDKDKMKAYRDQLDEIDKRREDVEKAVRQMRLQTDINSLSQSIADALLSAFEAGEDGIESMDKAFDKFIKNALVNSLRLKLINPIVEDMVNKLDQYMAKNDNSPVGFNFDYWRDKLNGVGKTFNEAMESAFAGLGLEKESSSSTEKGSLKNDIQGISEQQAGRLEAEFGGLRIAQLQLLETTKSNHIQLYMIAQDKLSQLIAIQQNAYRTANNTDRLANIENAIVSLNNKVSSSDAARRGAGL